jgi:hypothetical protein
MLLDPRTIRYALRNWGTALRFCLIILITNTPRAAVLAIIAVSARH